jgi:hypothetical protein
VNTLLERALNLAARAAPAVAGGQIIYTRGDATVWITATWGRTEFEVANGDGVRVEHTDRDFIVESDKLILNGTRATPAKDDRITVVAKHYRDNSVFEVLSLGGSEGCYRLCDPEGRFMRIHAKKVSA